ncbi:unnamed protein product, partial [Haemonchus placei]|uniref:Uncharacterized protein n=1 Tax=Haemonchus placei TaxID=6290 RepID=A0A0N4VZK9_HAEPC
MMRMRQWKSTLRVESSIQAMPDVCVEGREPPPPIQHVSVDDSMDEERSPLEAAETMFAKMPTASVVAATAATTVAPSPKVGNRPQTLDVSTHRERTTSEK